MGHVISPVTSCTCKSDRGIDPPRKNVNVVDVVYVASAQCCCWAAAPERRAVGMFNLKSLWQFEAKLETKNWTCNIANCSTIILRLSISGSFEVDYSIENERLQELQKLYFRCSHPQFKMFPHAFGSATHPSWTWPSGSPYPKLLSQLMVTILTFLEPIYWPSGIIPGNLEQFSTQQFPALTIFSRPSMMDVFFHQTFRWNLELQPEGRRFEGPGSSIGELFCA